MEEVKITWPEDLRPGDIFLGPIGGLVGLGVGLGQLVLGEAFRSGTLSVRHVAMVVEAGEWPGPARIAQAMPNGAEVVDFRWDHHWTEKCAWVRLLEDYPGQGEDAAEVALAMVRDGVGYSFATYPALAAIRLGIAADRLQGWVDRRRPPVDWLGRMDGREPAQLRFPERAICSRFADFAWTAAGHDVLEETRPGVATPGMMADQFSQRTGATWARPRGIKLPARSWVI